MKLSISFKHLEHTPAIDAKIREKSQRLEKYLDGQTTVKWTCYVDESHAGLHFAEIQVHGPKCDFHAKAQADNLYKCFDMALEKVEKQLQKKKEKWKNQMHEAHHEIEIRDPEAAWLDKPTGYDDFKKVI